MGQTLYFASFSLVGITVCAYTPSIQPGKRQGAGPVNPQALSRVVCLQRPKPRGQPLVFILLLFDYAERYIQRGKDSRLAAQHRGVRNNAHVTAYSIQAPHDPATGKRQAGVQAQGPVRLVTLRISLSTSTVGFWRNLNRLTCQKSVLLSCICPGLITGCTDRVREMQALACEMRRGETCLHSLPGTRIRVHLWSSQSHEIIFETP